MTRAPIPSEGVNRPAQTLAAIADAPTVVVTDAEGEKRKIPDPRRVAAMTPHPQDTLSVSWQDMEYCGLDPNEWVPKIVRSDDWAKAGQPSRYRELQRAVNKAVGPCELPLLTDPRTKENMGAGLDALYTCVPRAYQDLLDAEQEQRHRGFESNLRPVEGQNGIMGSHEELYKRPSKEDVEAMYEDHIRQGLVGSNSPTSGMDLDEATRYMYRQYIRDGMTKDEAIQAFADEQAMFRGNNHRTDFGNDEWEKMVEAGHKRNSAASKFSFSGVGFAKESPNSPLVQARNKSAAAAGKGG